MTKKSTLPQIANVNDGYLIITLTKSITPVVWRLELEKAKVAAFEILKKDKKHTLTIKVASKSVEAIGAFKDPESALEALLAISEALQKASQNPKAVTTTTAEQVTSTATPQGANSKNNRTAIALFATCIVLGLFYYYWVRIIPTAQTFETQSISSNTDPANQTGVAVSADDLLKGF
jgi:hypothetical protein